MLYRKSIRIATISSLIFVWFDRPTPSYHPYLVALRHPSSIQSKRTELLARGSRAWAMAATLQPVLPCFLLLLLLTAGAAGAGRHAGGRTLVFILAGQSNMSGRGGATSGTWDGVVPPKCAPSPRILRLSLPLRWEEAREPLHAGIDVGNVLGVGPGMPFAHALLAAASGKAVPTMGLVPCAQGGTPLANWTRGTELYYRMVTRARAALAQCGGAGELAAMLWYQGETDAMKKEDAELYQGRMEALVRNVRRDLGRPTSSSSRSGSRRRSTAASSSTASGKPRRPSRSRSRMSGTSTPWGCPSRVTTRILPPRLRSSSATC
ncbi:putative carbohydrate esterase [Panicum miliaceum]|uniref:Carbohydrate esterase n=1 Tax=Panicum miliaceum TaxID=4540 RepID=A0A3L6RRJ8_PANMI|nr:putative carbohydrate esterase [Panicum miliaceum]